MPSATPRPTLASSDVAPDDWSTGNVVLDAHGEVLPLFHGTNAHAYSEGSIETFNTRPPSGRGAAFFTNDRSLAAQYGERVYEVSVCMRNPLIVLGGDKSWAALSDATRIDGNANEVLLAASGARADELNAIYAGLAADFGDDEHTVLPRFTSATDSMVGSTLGSLPGLGGNSIETDAIVKAARKLGFDGVIFRDIQDSPTLDAGYARTIADVYAVFDASQILITQTGQADQHAERSLRERMIF